MKEQHNDTRPDPEALETYERPEVRSREVFESLAITCIKGDLQQCSRPDGTSALRS